MGGSYFRSQVRTGCLQVGPSIHPSRQEFLARGVVLPLEGLSEGRTLVSHLGKRFLTIPWKKLVRVRAVSCFRLRVPRAYPCVRNQKLVSSP